MARTLYIISSVEPVSDSTYELDGQIQTFTLTHGSMWYDTANEQLKVYTGTTITPVKGKKEKTKWKQFSS